MDLDSADANRSASQQPPKKKSSGWVRNRSRFSILGMLILMAILSLALAAWNQISPAFRQWAAVRPLLFNNNAWVETTPSDTPDWIKGFMKPGETENIEVLHFEDKTGLKPGYLDCLNELPHLKQIHFNPYFGLTDKEVEQLSKSKCQSLEELTLDNNYTLTSASAAHLIKLKNLKFVSVSNTGMDWRAFLEFQKRPDLTVQFDDFAKKPIDVDISELEILIACLPELDFQRQIEFNIVNAESLDWQMLGKHFAFAKNLDIAHDRTQLTLQHKAKGNLLFHFKDISSELTQQLSEDGAFSEVKECYIASSRDRSLLKTVSLCTKMKTLTLEDCAFTEFRGYANPNLQKLSIAGCYDMQSISSLSQFESLRRLDLSNMARLDTISFDHATSPANTKLANLDLTKLPSMFDFTLLAQANAMQNLAINDCDGLTDISWLSGKHDLTSVNVSRCENLKDVTNLRDLPALKRLRLVYCSNLARVANCEFASATKLSIWKGAIMDFSDLSSNKGLTKLSLFEQPLQSCRHLQSLTSLEELVLIDNPLLESIAGLEKLPNLKKLDLRECSRLGKLNRDEVAQLRQSLESFRAGPVLEKAFEDSRAQE